LFNSRKLLALALVAGGMLCVAAEANAWGGRMYFGGHPYHSGNYAVPPVSAYQGVRVRPPIRYGAPAYYFPQSYLGPGAAYSYVPHPPRQPAYGSIPVWRSGGYYMSARAVTVYHPW